MGWITGRNVCSLRRRDEGWGSRFPAHWHQNSSRFSIESQETQGNYESGVRPMERLLTAVQLPHLDKQEGVLWQATPILRVSFILQRPRQHRITMCVGRLWVKESITLQRTTSKLKWSVLLDSFLRGSKNGIIGKYNIAGVTIILIIIITKL